MNTPEMKYSGSIVACTIGWAASGEPISPATAKPMHASASVPTTAVQAIAASAPAPKADALADAGDDEQQRST